MWCPCKVVRVADGETDKGTNNSRLTSACRTLAPRGMLLVEWEPDPDRGEKEATQCWYLLDPKKWQGHARNVWAGDVHRGWRFHPAELAARAARARAGKGKGGGA